MGVSSTARPLLEVAAADNILLTTTNPTTLLNYVAGPGGSYIVWPWVSATAATPFQLTVTWTDRVLGAMSYDWYPAGSQVSGGAAQAALKIEPQPGTQITVTATAGTANQVTVSVSIYRRG